MSQIRISMRPRIYAQVSDALRLIHTNAQNNTFLSNLRTMNVYAVPELNPTYQEMIAQIYGQSLKNANLSEKEIQLWQHLFSWMRTSKKTNSQDNLGTLCGKADVKGYRLLSTLQQSEESLIVAVSSLVSMIKSTKLEISTQAWVDIASLLFSEGTEDEVNVRKKIANDYYHHELNEKTPKKPKTTETTETMATTESNNMEQTNG